MLNFAQNFRKCSEYVVFSSIGDKLRIIVFINSVNTYLLIIFNELSFLKYNNISGIKYKKILFIYCKKKYISHTNVNVFLVQVQTSDVQTSN